MKRKSVVMTEERYIEIGRAHHSDKVAQEAAEARVRWKRDLATLARYGHGEHVLAAFETDLREHTKLRENRPEAIAAKRQSVVERDRVVAQGWAWVDQVVSIFTLPARTQELLALRLDEATPVDDAGLSAGIATLAAILNETKPQLPADAMVEQRLAEAKPLCEKLGAFVGEVRSAKAATMADTTKVDLFDGKLYIWIRDLNQAGRRAIRNGILKAEQSEYRYHHLNRSGRPAAQEQPANQPPSSVPAA